MRRLLALFTLAGLFFSGVSVNSSPQEEYERGTFSIYFMDEKVGYEEFVWRRDATGIVLSVEGRITKPIQMSIEELVIRMNASFIPTSFRFRGSVGGVAQDIESELQDGEARNTIRVTGQEQTSRIQIRRDAFLLPNPTEVAALDGAADEVREYQQRQGKTDLDGGLDGRIHGHSTRTAVP